MSKIIHKHNFKECILQHTYNTGNHGYTQNVLASYCTVCGKIGYKFEDRDSIVQDYTRTSSDGYPVRIGNNELYSRYGRLMPTFTVPVPHEKASFVSIV